MKEKIIKSETELQNALEQKMEQAAHEALELLAQRVADELEWRAKECVAEFYEEYEPEYYERYGQLEKTIFRIVEKMKRTGDLCTIVAGVNISSEDMEPLYDICKRGWNGEPPLGEAGTDLIFDWSLNQGWHGYPGQNSKKKNHFTSLTEKMNEYIQDIYSRKLKQWSDEATTTVLKNNRIIL